MTTGYPGALDTSTDLGFLTVANILGGQSSASITNSGTTLQVNFDPVAQGWPSAGYLVIGPTAGPWEVCAYSARSASGGAPGSFTLSSRGTDGTAAASHASGEPVGMPSIAEQLNAHGGAIIALEQKIGSYNSQTPSVSGRYLRSRGSFQSEWNTLQSGDINTAVASATVTVDKLTLGGATTLQHVAGAYPYVDVGEGLRVPGRLTVTGDLLDCRGTLRLNTNNYALISYQSTPLVACSGSTAVIGGIGSSGPASTGQAGWVKIKIGTSESDAWMPYWT